MDALNANLEKKLNTIFFLLAFALCFLPIKAHTSEAENLGPAPAALFAKNKAFVEAKYVRSEHMVQMRDGVRLFTVVYRPRSDAELFPFLLVRTPYSVANYDFSPVTASVGPTPAFDREGFIFVLQDVRGKNRSEGEYVPLRPFLPDKLDENDTDEASDLYDTVEWLLANTEGHNGKVGIWGISADGLLAVQGMMDPHPALAGVSLQGTPADFYVGDDFFHNGAFHLAYIFSWVSGHARSAKHERFELDQSWAYDFFRDLTVPLAKIDETFFGKTVTLWDNIVRDATYSEFWRRQNVLQHLNDVDIPVLNVAGWYDVEDFWGSLEIYKHLENVGPKGNNNSIIVGPWRHGGWYGWDGDELANIYFGEKTSLFYRQNYLLPFFKYYLKGVGEWTAPDVTAFDTGQLRWFEFDHWPPVVLQKPLSLYFGDHSSLDLQAPKTGGHDSFISDPYNPVPYSMTIRKKMGAWWVMEDQRFAASRPDVLTYETQPLSEDITLAGPVEVQLNVSITGTDADWVVKLIDVFPENEDLLRPNPNKSLAGYQLIVTSEIIRGRYRESLTEPKPFEPNEITSVRFVLPDRLHTFKKGHRIMVQVQSSWFPMFDRNPQTYVENIFFNEPDNLQVSRHRLHRDTDNPSYLRFNTLVLGDQ